MGWQELIKRLARWMQPSCVRINSTSHCPGASRPRGESQETITDRLVWSGEQASGQRSVLRRFGHECSLRFTKQYEGETEEK